MKPTPTISFRLSDRLIMGMSVCGVSHTFGDRQVLDDVELLVPERQFVSLVGPSGCGKTTLLRILAGLLTPTHGQASVGGESVIGRPGQTAYMPQRDLLMPWRRALDNAVVGAEVDGMDRRQAHKQARELFQRFGLAGFEHAWPAQLSGGMRQRLALLRTFMIERDVLLLDEPFGALDAITRQDMHVWLQDVWSTDQRTVLLVTHDVEEALMLSDVVYVMSPRPGRIVAHVEADFPRPRRPDLVTTDAFNRLKAELLQALRHR